MCQFHKDCGEELVQEQSYDASASKWHGLLNVCAVSRIHLLLTARSKHLLMTSICFKLTVLQLAPFRTEYNRTASMKRHTVGSTTYFQIPPESSATSDGCHGNAGLRESCFAASLHVTQLCMTTIH